MFKRRVAKSNSLLVRNSSRVTDTSKPNSTSLIVNPSRIQTDIDDLPDSVKNALSVCDVEDRKSISVFDSFSQKYQSTPVDKDAVATAKRLEEKEKSLSSEDINVARDGSQPGSCYFDEVISSCGAVASYGNGSYLLSEDQGVFTKKIGERLEKDEEKEKFLKSFEVVISDNETFKKMLAHTQTSKDCQGTRGPLQDPIIRLLLNVESLQTHLLHILMQKLAAILLDGESKNEEVLMIASVVRQMRFLSRVEGGSKITSKLFEIIELASVNIQREIIFSIPEIISNDELEEATKHLLELLKLNSALTHVIIDALTNLSLNDQLRSQVRLKILNRLEKCPLEYLPLLVQFIITRCNNDELTEVLQSLRRDLPFSLRHYERRKEERLNNEKEKEGKSNDEGSYIKLTFENLKFSVMASKHMTETWIKIITNINNPLEFRCVDLVMMIIMYSSVSGRKNQLISLFRNKIKCSVITVDHVEEAFKILGVILTEHSSTVLEMASIFLKSYEQFVCDFAAVLYEASFSSFSFYHRQNVISEILLHIGTGSPTCINAALSILCKLTENQGAVLSDHTVSIMSLLMKLPDLEPMQVRNLIDVIAVLVFSNPEENSGLQDELQMFIRKQISSPKMEQNKKGVIAAIMYAKQAAVDGRTKSIDLDDINSMLEMAFGSSCFCGVRRTFFNDELATVLREVSLNDGFVRVWKERSYKYALDNLFVKNIELENEYFPMSLLYGLETDEAKKFVFPAVDFVRRAFEKKSSNQLLASSPSSIRLLWCCENDFEKILPLVSASVIMPDHSVLDNFDTLTVVQQKLIMDCLFLCSNYFIECINAFCTQKTGDRVLIRIKQLMELRKLIAKYIGKIPNYVPPVCQQYAQLQKINPKRRATESTKPKRGKKRKWDENQEPKNQDESVVEASEGIPSTSASSSSQVVGRAGAATTTTAEKSEGANERGNLHAYRSYLREIHCHAFKLLRMDLKLSPTKVFKKTKLSDHMFNEESWYYKASDKPALDSADLLLLLEDFIFKCERILKNKKYSVLHKGKSSDSVIENVSTEIFLTGSIKILPKICNKIEILAGYCKDLLEANDFVYDAPGMYPKDAADVKLSLAAALGAVAELLSWHGFRSSNRKSYLKDMLTAIGKKGKSTQENSISVLAIEAGNYLTGFAQHVLLISGALSIVRAVRCCINYCSVSALLQTCSLAKLCYDLLLRPWFDVNGTPERGPEFNQCVDFLLGTYFSLVENKLKVVKSVAQIALDEGGNLMSGRDATMDTFKTINKSNFPLLYRSLCGALVSAAVEQVSICEDHDNLLKIWSDIVHTLLMLVEIVKMHSSRINLSALLKRSHSVIQLFISKGMPVMESALRIKSGEVLKCLKSLQAVTRFLHSVCCHSKLTSDATVAAHVPAIRSSCERITLEVKGMLILNKIPLDCITIATLKNKDLQGNDILSQDTMRDESSEGESDLPPESENCDSENENIEKDISTQESNSEIY